MGNFYSTAPKEGEGHPALFYKGVQAASEARYTVSELYFINALRKHPAREFWNTLMGAATVKMNKSVERTTSAGREGENFCGTAEDDLPTAGTPGEAELKTEAFEENLSGDAKSQQTRAHGMSGSTVQGLATVAASDAPKCMELPMYDSTFVNLSLPFDAGLKSILDYYRLLADIAVTYLNQLPTTRHKEKVRSLAARYCLFTISHTQVFLHCLTLWKEEKVGDGGGFIDYDRKRHLKGEVKGMDSDAVSEGVVRIRVVRDECAPKEANKPFLLVTLALAEANCRYYFLSLVISYSFLLLDVYKEMPEQKKKFQVFCNLQDQLDAAYGMLWTVAKDYPDDYIGQLIMRTVPAPERGTGTNSRSLEGDSSRASCAKTLNLSDDQQLHLYSTAAPWSPLQSALHPLLVARAVRLRAQGRVMLSFVAKLLSPAQRMCYPYMSWHADVDILQLPGCNPYLLERALPGFVHGKGTKTLESLKVFISNANEATPDNPNADGRSDVAVPIQAVADSTAAGERTDARAAQKKRDASISQCEKEMRKRARRINGDLNLKDERTCVVLCQEEAAILGIVAMLVFIEAHVLAGQRSAAECHVHAVRALVSGLKGPNSPDVRMLSCVLASLGF